MRGCLGKIGAQSAGEPRAAGSAAARFAILAAIVVAGAAAVAATIPAAAQGATDPGLPGPLPTGRVDRDIPVTDGGLLDADIYFPESEPGVVDPEACPCPLVTFGHGFSRNRSRYSDTGEHLASRGFIVVMPQFRCGFLGCNHDRASDDMVAVIDWMLERDTDPDSIFFERIAREKIGTSGHSAGGLWSLVAAARDARVDASAPMDPVDNDELGVGEVGAARAAIAISYSEPSSCNDDGSAEDLYAAASAQKRGTKLVDANHCDPEKDGDFFGCELTCGFWNPERHERYLRYVTGWLEYTLHCDPAYKPWALGARVEQDLDDGSITYDAALAPPVPAGLTAEPDGAAVALTREPPDRCEPLDAWRVYRGTTPGGPYDLIADGLDPALTTYRDAAVSSATTYHYVVRDVVSDFATLYESPSSPEASATTPAPTAAEASNPRAGDAPLRVARGPGTALELNYDPAPCATDHTAYWTATANPLTGPPSWTDQACELGASGTATIDPGTTAPGQALLIVVAGNETVTEGSYGRDATGAERPEAVDLPDCDYPQALSPGCF